MTDEYPERRGHFYREERFYQAVYVISVAAELAGVHPQTLRGYERKGLLEPARTAGGDRRYSEADLAQLQRIHELTEEGLNLAGVIRVLQLEQRVSKLQQQLEALQRANQVEDEH
ncbi:MAG: MerR family transcriptional regulator [Acidimicrobiaceae bacterium]|nr:MerR family transcriptional regulator [Acidimicrobiaceae bacterium]